MPSARANPHSAPHPIASQIAARLWDVSATPGIIRNDQIEASETQSKVNGKTVRFYIEHSDEPDSEAGISTRKPISIGESTTFKANKPMGTSPYATLVED